MIEMAKVYVVTWTDDGGSCDVIEGIFSTREGADDYVARARQSPQHDDMNDPEGWDLDEKSVNVLGPTYWVQVDLETGKQWDVYRGAGHPEMRHPMRCRVEVIPGPCPPEHNSGFINVHSPVSIEDARRVAAEEYQGWLRARAVAGA